MLGLRAQGLLGPRTGLSPLLLGRSVSVVVKDDHVTVEDGGKEHHFHFQWLRDHCRDPAVYNSVTNQRSVNLVDFASDISPTEVKIDERRVRITWPDKHKTSFDIPWLLSCACPVRADKYKEKVGKFLWSKASFPSDVAVVTTAKHLLTDVASLREVLRSILRNGFAMVDGVEPSVDGTIEVVRRVGPLITTMYGNYSRVKSKPVQNKDDFSDSSFTNEGLEPHTDTTYLNQASGLQVFHCFRNAKSGGENIFVDGFMVADVLRQEHPDTYQFLSGFPIEAEYVYDDKQGRRDHFLNIDTVLKHHPISGDLEQFRFNVYDRGVHFMSLEEQRRFYEHYRRLAALVRREDLHACLPLVQGRLMFVDNWRVMHGRKAFSGGERDMFTCYVSRDDFLNRARVLDLL